MDHLVSSPILSLSFFFVLFFGSSQARSPGLSGNLPCDIWLPALRQKVKGAPGAQLMEMQKTGTTHNIQHFLSESLQHHEDVSGYEYTHPAAAHQVETLQLPRRSKQQNAKFTISKKIFPWMKESRHANQKPGRRIAGLYDMKLADGGSNCFQ